MQAYAINWTTRTRSNVMNGDDALVLVKNESAVVDTASPVRTPA